MFSHSSSERLIESSLSHLRLAMLDLENRREYMSEIKCLCGTVYFKRRELSRIFRTFLKLVEEVSDLEVGPEREKPLWEGSERYLWRRSVLDIYRNGARCLRGTNLIGQMGSPGCFGWGSVYLVRRKIEIYGTFSERFVMCCRLSSVVCRLEEHLLGRSRVNVELVSRRTNF